MSRKMRSGRVAAALLSAFVLSWAAPAAIHGEEQPEPSAEELLKLNQVWKGDFDGMAQRRIIRVLVTFSRTHYYIDRGQQRGVAYEAIRAFEDFVNVRLKNRNLKVHAIIIPVGRDQLITGLVEGRGDIAAANLTITAERRKLVDFSDPGLTEVKEYVVTDRSVPMPAGLDDLAGREIFVRASSSYYGSLQRLNESLEKKGKPPVTIVPADELLEDEDLLEMVDAGLIPATVADSHIADFWNDVFDNLRVDREVPVSTGGQIAWAFRKNSPRLKEVIDAFVKDHRKGTAFGNILYKRYLRDTDRLKNPVAAAELRKFREMTDLFKKYSDRYGFDWLMVVAQAYQESRLDQNLRSKAGAVGVMQVLPKTAADSSVGVRGIEKLENNIHAGVKYMRYLFDQHLKDAPMDPLNRNLFAFAAYNAGPARVAQLRKKAADMGLDPNRWFQNVEIVAAKDIGRETVQYVSNIYKYYVAYRLAYEHSAVKKDAKDTARVKS
jgi:membrane-bound lytic murein transglycosylase MltF